MVTGMDLVTKTAVPLAYPHLPTPVMLTQAIVLLVAQILGTAISVSSSVAVTVSANYVKEMEVAV